MRQLVVNTFVTLDGVMQAPGGPEEDTTGGFEHGGWSVGYWDDVLSEHMTKVSSGTFDLLLGRRTYEIFAAHWPYADDPMARKLNAARKYVASRTLERVDWEGSELIVGDVPERVAKLKQEDGPEIQVHGSAELLQTLSRHDLVDEYRLMTFPVVLGEGKRLFAGGAAPAGLRLVESKAATTGVVISTYERSGEVRYGSFALEDPTEAELRRRERLAGE